MFRLLHSHRQAKTEHSLGTQKVCTLWDPISFSIILNGIVISSCEVISIVNYTEYVTLYKHKNIYMYLNHRDGWFVELKCLSHSRTTGQQQNQYQAIRSV